MTGREKLLRSISELEATLLHSAELAGDKLDDHRQQGIMLRRLIAGQTAAIASLVDEAIGDPARRAAFRNEFSKMRSALAYHQASWPIVAIDVHDPKYVASVSSMRDSNRHFFGWVRSALAAR